MKYKMTKLESLFTLREEERHRIGIKITALITFLQQITNKN
jgi:hypothetical protein